MVGLPHIPGNALSDTSNTSPRMQDMRNGLGPAADPEAGDDGWGNDARGQSSPRGAEPRIDAQQIPPALRPGEYGIPGHVSESHREERQSPEPARQPSLSGVPSILRPGPSPGAETNNPFFRKMAEEQASRKPSLTESFGQLSVGEPSNNPWHHALDPAHTGSSGHSGDHPRPSSAGLAAVPGGQEEVVLWDSSTSRPDLSHPANANGPVSQSTEYRSAVDDLRQLDPAQSHASDSSKSNAKSEHLDDWNLIDHEPGQGTSSSTPEQTISKATGLDEVPKLPPRPRENEQLEGHHQSGHLPPPPPPRNGRAGVEVYHVKKIRWIDSKAANNPRTSPILVQNENGPCPLVALVNALVLTTPENQGESYLIHFLISKDQVELEALLQAVIEELMSSRCTDENAVLPDMSDLYNFLASLDTGMNVNPRFLPSQEQINTMKRTSLGHVHPSERDDCIPGGFEDTREMKLYATFSIPLFHGWIPEADEPAFAAMKALAESYDEARILDFKEMDLHQKLADPNGDGLTAEEQDAYQDIMTVKAFLDTYGTQLTPYGLEVLRKSMEPGSIAILFRNDHFSTLYKHPETQVLFTLATDAGLANHEEIVWESLTNVKGATEFYSGDFRIVGGAQGKERPSSSSFSSGSNPGEWPSIDEASSSGWQTGADRRNRNIEPSQMSPKHEQEDQDYAMALQLQEEEEERHRRELAQRQRESRLSEQFIEQGGRQPAGSADRIAGLRQSSISATTTGARRPGMAPAPRGQTVRPLVPPAETRASRPAVYRPPPGGSEEAPPSYDESAHDAPFRPPVGHPTHPHSTPSSVRVTQGSRTSSASTPGGPGPSNTRPGRQQIPAGTAMGPGGGSHGKKGDCVVM